MKREAGRNPAEVVKKSKCGKNKFRPARMVLLENFGAGPPAAKFQRPDCGKFVGLLLRQVTQPMMPGIPKFGRRAILKGPRTKKTNFLTPFEGLRWD